VEEETYTVDEAARILGLTPGRIRQMLRAGELEGL
jgi:excisionase family DNA binding protein